MILTHFRIKIHEKIIWRNSISAKFVWRDLIQSTSSTCNFVVNNILPKIEFVLGSFELQFERQPVALTTEPFSFQGESFNPDDQPIVEEKIDQQIIGQIFQNMQFSKLAKSHDFDVFQNLEQIFDDSAYFKFQHFLRSPLLHMKLQAVMVPLLTTRCSRIS